MTHRKKSAFFVGIISTVALVAGALAIAPAQGATSSVEVQWKVDNDWGSGFQVTATVTNKTTSTLNPWTIDIFSPNQLTSLWNGTSSTIPGGASGFRVTAPSWAKTLAPNATTTFGLNMNRKNNASAMPTGCAVAGTTCTIPGVTPSPTPTPSPTVTPTPTPSPTVTPTPTPSQTVTPTPTPSPTVTPTPTPSPTVTPTPTPSPTVTPTPSPTVPSGGLALSYALSSWGGGGTYNVTVTNSGPAISSWKVDIPWTVSPTSVWSGVNQSTSGHVIVANEAWNGSLATGASATFGMTANYSSVPPAPTTCTATTSAGARTCGFGSSPSPTPTPSPTVTPTPSPTVTPSPTPTVPNPNPLPADFKVAPFVDFAGWPMADLVGARAATGISNYNLGFIVSSGGCDGAWGGYSSLAPTASGWQIESMNSQIDTLQASGGKVAVSFGGAAGTEAAIACSSAASLKAVYKGVIDRYNLTRIDFDIEGGAQGDHAANTRRGQAIASLQADAAAAGKQLTVSFTLPVLQSGLTHDGLGVLQDTVNAGARVDLVNIMAMDYGGAEPQMGQAAISAGTNTANQIGFVYPSMTAAQRLSRVGITAMIGENDIANEVFTVANAQEVTTWAKANNVGMLSWWSLSRDVNCPNNAKIAANNCSGVSDPAWSFARAFLG